MKKFVLPALVALIVISDAALPARAQILVAAQSSTPSVQSGIFEDVPLYDWSYKALIQLNSLSAEGETLPNDSKSLIRPMTYWEFALAIVRWNVTHSQTELAWQDAKARDIGEALEIKFAPSIEEVLSQDAQSHTPLFDFAERPLASNHVPYSVVETATTSFYVLL